MFAFFNDLHIDLSVAIEKRENFDATIDRETISVQNIDFFDVADVAIDDENDTFSERSRTTSDVEIERNKSFDDVKDVTDDSTTNFDDENDEKIIDRDDETENFDSKTDETTNSTNC